MSVIPDYLLMSPSLVDVDPPLVTIRQELPLEQLPWEDLERLYLRLVQNRFPVADWQDVFAGSGKPYRLRN